MERTTSDFDLDFIARAASVTDISPGRETGIMLHGRGPRRFFECEVGVFRLAEPPLKPLVESGTDGAMLTAARFTLRPAPRASESRSREPSSREPSWLIRPLRRRWPAVLRGLLCQRPPTAAGSRGPMDSREALDQGELLRQADSREGESVSNSDLSDLIVDGGYVSGAWRIVGSPRRSRRSVDVAARFERLGFHSTSQFDAPSLGSRARSHRTATSGCVDVRRHLAGEPLGQSASQRDPRVIRRRNGDTTRDTAGSVEEPDATSVFDVTPMSDLHALSRVIRAACLLAFLLLLAAGSVGAQTASTLFDDRVLHTLQIAIHSRDWDQLRSTYLENDHYPADLTWNGIRVTNVGVRSRGRTTQQRRQAWSGNRLRSLQHGRSVPGTAGTRSRQYASRQVDDSGTRGHGVPPALWRSGSS